MTGFETPVLLILPRLFQGHSWINFHLTAVITVSSVRFSNLKHDLEGIPQNKV